MNFYYISAYCYLAILLMSVLIYAYKIHFWKYATKTQRQFKSAKQDKRYAILIPARDESKVIANLLDSIKNQTYDKSMFQIFVMVADKTDKTIEICKNYKNTTCFCLQKKVATKGATLNELVKKLSKQNKHFDGYFVIDADAVILPNFIEKMHNCLQAGYQVVMGGKITNRPSGNWVRCGTVLTWTFINTLNNKCRSANGQNVILQGSPLLISNNIIEKFWQYSWPFVGLTEDVELTYMCDLNNFRSYYCEDALCYDQAPISYKQSVYQRLRWIKGHNKVDAQYTKKLRKTKCKYQKGIYKFDRLYSLIPPILIVVTTLVFSIYSAIVAIVASLQNNPIWMYALWGCILTFIGCYLVLCFWTLFAMFAERKRFKLEFWQGVQAFFTVPLFFASYVPIYFKTFITKNIKWVKIERSDNCKTKTA